jgi:biopolymer transport protein ExbD
VGGGAGHKHRRWRLSGKKELKVDSVRNDINVTPLVDVMLVLLIIFMLMTLIMGRGHDVTLPTAKNFSEEKDNQQPVVTITGPDDGYLIYVEKIQIGPASPQAFKEMREQIDNHWKNPLVIEAGGAGRVFLKAHVDTPYEKVYPVLKFLNRDMAVGAIDIAIAKAGEK